MNLQLGNPFYKSTRETGDAVMSTEESILERLNVLEKQNRRMRRIGIAAIVIAASLLVMGQKTAVNRTVEASEFILRDSNGIVRSKWAMTKEGPDGRPMLSLSGPNEKKSHVSLFGPSSSEGPQLALTDGDRSMGFGRLGVPDALTLFMNSGGGSIEFEVTSNPYIKVHDKEDFEALVGNTRLVTELTGETHQTSAASVTLTGKDKKVLWKAP
jgi:hypothetical protein